MNRHADGLILAVLAQAETIETVPRFAEFALRRRVEREQRVGPVDRQVFPAVRAPDFRQRR